MEESSEIIIARLVLGYLRNENCRGAYKEFLRSSAHLQENNIAKCKFLRTRFMGLSLEEIFREYVDIHQMVQARLEATDYFHEQHSKKNLLSQILYLFNKTPTIDISRTSTPCHRSPREFNIEDASPCSYIDQASDVETTPVHALPGNICSGKNDRYPKKTTKKGVRSSRTELDDAHSGDSDMTPNSAELVNTEVLAHTLLENKEFHEKIAQTINKVVEKQHRVSGELDKTVKTVVKETEEDPMFDQLLDEIIGSAALIDNPRPDCNKTSNSKEDPSNKISKNNKKQDNSSAPPASKEDEINKQNSEAINCIVANSTEKTIAPVPSSGEVIVFDGSLDNFMNSNMCTAPIASSTPVMPIQNQIYVNTTGLLITTGSNTATMTSLTNKTMQVPLLLTEQDILTMPTVIVSDNPIPNSVKKKSEFKQIYPRIAPQNQPQPFHPNTAKPTDNPPKLGLKKVVYPVVSSSSSMVTSTPASTSRFEASLPQLKKDSEKRNLPEDDVEVVTQPATPPALENVQKVTPKSGSHVRNLDFSTPPKINKKDLENAPAKQVTKSLFPKKPKEVLVDVGKTWDSDLRVGATSEQSVSKTPKRRRKKQLSGKKTKKAKVTPDTTSSDAAALEAALQTPVKSSQEKAAHNEQDSDHPVKQSVVVEPTPEPQVSEASSTVEIQGKTILSPSKMNATKRSLVNTDVTESASRFITPENGQEGAAVQPMKANRNIIPMLETPLKDYLPKTPGAHTPQDLNVSALSSNITPFTKMLEANLTGLDINQIPTPNIPITPNFPPFTPNVDFVSPFSNRPTDYSASSSYYQPSDNEQNKSLETQLREIEKKPIDNKTKNERLKNFNKNVIGKKNLNLMKRNVLSSSSSEDDSKSSSDSFCKENNDTVIFSKSESPVQRAYSLRTRNVDKVSKADCSKKEVKKTPRKVVRRKAQNKEKGNEDEKSINEKKTEADILQPSIVPEVEEADEKLTETAELNATTESAPSSKVEQEGVEAEVQTPPVKSKKSKTPKKSSKSTLTPSQLSLRKELEEKKKRMITNMKNDSKPQQKSAKKQNSAFKIKPIANLTNSKRKPRKAPSPKKALQADKEDLRLVMEDLEHSDDSDEEVPLPFKNRKSLQVDAIAELKQKKRSAEVFVEEINDFIRLDLVFTSLYTTYEFGIEDCEGAELKKAVENESTTPSKTDVENNLQENIVEDQNASTQTDVKVDAKLIRKENLESHVPVPDDDLMNFALTGCDREESTDGHSTSSKKRKIKNEESSHSGKKCSTLLKKIDVDVF